jgi:pimeloyl-ACP methyl ester carboxylesterase
MGVELPRAGLDAVMLGPTWPLLRRAPAGDGHPVLVLPGLGASDVSTRILRGFLRDRGYHVHAWRLGRNLGPRPSTVEGLRRRVAELAERHRRPMSIVGWSLGGIYAREIAKVAAPLVRQVITLGSPYQLRDPAATNARVVYRVVTSRHQGGGPVDPRLREDPPRPLSVPATSIYTRTDAIVPWEACTEVPSATSENIEVRGSHGGLGHNPVALWIIADRLAQPEGSWKPFRPRGPVCLLLPNGRAITR